jgi:diamine N-acetyltransferase
MIQLKPIDRHNVWDCVELKVAEHQRKFVASNVVSLAQAKAQEECIPLAVYDGDIMVGFLMYCIDVDDNNYWIYRVMIGEEHQGKGYGKQALNLLINKIKEDKNHDKILLGVHVESEFAVKLYKSCGFEFTGQIMDGEHIMQLNY